MAYNLSKWGSGILEPWKAYFAETERIKIDNAIGRVSATTIRIYPPGVPIVKPGTVFTPAIISELEAAHNAYSNVVGINLNEGRLVDVVKVSKKQIRQQRLDIRTITSQEVFPELAIEIADLFGAGFSAAPYFHFALHESDPLTSFPPSMDFLAWAKALSLPDGVDKEALKERLLLQAQDSAESWYREEEVSTIKLPTGFYRWSDPGICRKVIADRLSDPGYVTLVRDKATMELIGLLHSRMGTVERLFMTEEWYNPCVFSKYQNDQLLDNPERFYGKMRSHFQLTPTEHCMTISAQILHPSALGGDIFYAMMRSMALKITPEHADLPLICEISPEGTAHVLNVAASRRIVFDVISNGHPIVYSEKASDALYPFVTDESQWMYRLKKEIRRQREYKTQHYVRSPKDNPNVEVRFHGELGLAVFATAPIKAGERIAVFEGETYNAGNALAVPAMMEDHVIQTGPSSFVFGYQGLAHCLCHSCDPNCGIKNYTEIFAIRDIKAGEQVTWDYRCSENSIWLLENCLCGATRCTGRVANFDSLPDDIKSEYLSKGMVSEWIVDSIAQKNSANNLV